ncbi:MAG: nickel pincer cofactor biosynthesis protein LarB [Desulfovibrio sp.]|nr:nickel pincer cofactor biosynthesis protein LarB [Desulfovibrio sp.]
MQRRGKLVNTGDEVGQLGLEASVRVLFDHGRVARIGLPEAVFCAGKPRSVLLELLGRFKEGNEPILFTRLEPEIFASLPAELKKSYDYDPISRTAYAGTCQSKLKGQVAIVSAGTADAFVSHEAARTLTYLGLRHLLFEDCGVAGLWRLTEHLEAINRCDCVIVVAGLDAALASVLGGLTPKPIFAVPTSVGYGVAKAGRAALQSMLVSCAPGIGVLNIDNGYGAACAAARVLLGKES